MKNKSILSVLAFVILASMTAETTDRYTDENEELADIQNLLVLTDITQQVLEDTVKKNDKIAFMAVYLENGTIIAHFKPERIGKNFLDVDIEFSDCSREIFDAISSRTIYKGISHDPLNINNMVFIVKPLDISFLDYKLTVLIGIRNNFITVL
jgi:hypothetical protein